jgi:hypothetical protein
MTLAQTQRWAYWDRLFQSFGKESDSRKYVQVDLATLEEALDVLEWAEEVFDADRLTDYRNRLQAERISRIATKLQRQMDGDHGEPD